MYRSQLFAGGIAYDLVKKGVKNGRKGYALCIFRNKPVHDSAGYTYAWEDRRHRKSKSPTPRISKDETSDKGTYEGDRESDLLRYSLLDKIYFV